MTSRLAFLKGEPTEDAAPADGTGPRREVAVHALARLALEEALGADLRRALAKGRSLALVVQVPSAEWVRPVQNACEALAEWEATFARNGSSRQEDRPERGNDVVAGMLAGGRRVLGVSHDPDRLLPQALRAAADAVVRVDPPTNRLVARLILAVTGRRPAAMPPGVATGLDFWDICAAVRADAPARTAVERMVAASRRKAVTDPAVADAPDFTVMRGLGEVHAWGMRLLDDLAAWRRGELDFKQIDRNVVIASAPGFGKTTAIRALAKAAQLPLVNADVASLFSNSSGYLDGVIKQLEGAFAAALAVQPAILFLDEIDAIPDRRSLTDRERAWWNRLCVSALLGIEKLTMRPDARVCIVGATNFPDRLDPALIRPGRLSRVIRIEAPGADDLAAILRHHLGADLPGVDLRRLGELGLGASGAQAEAWVGRARAAARLAGRALREADLLAAVAPDDDRSPDTLWRHAVHEIGHAAATIAMSVGRIRQVDLLARDGGGGSTSVASLIPSTPTRVELERLVTTILAGRAAEKVFLGAASAGSGGGPTSDLARATRIVADIHGCLGLGATLTHRAGPGDAAGLLAGDPALREAVEADLVRLHAAADAFVGGCRPEIERAARALVERRALSGDDLRSLLAGEDATGEGSGGEGRA